MEVLPVQHSGEVVAVLSVGSHVRGEIPAKSCQAMEVLATQAAGAIARIRAEQSLRANRRLLEKTLHSLRSAVFVVNADTMVIEECNPATTQIFGYTRDELIGRTTASLHANEAMAEQFAGHLHSAVEDKGFLSDFEFKMRRKDGTVFPTDHSMMPIRNEVGRLVSWVSVVQDITERKRVEEELRQLPWRIIEAQETERLRVAREMHDGVNQVIASVKMRLRKVESHVGTLNPAAREILARCDKLLVQALEENRRIAHNLRPSDLDELGLAAACRNFCKEIQARTNLTVKCNIAPLGQRLPPAVELNLFRIVQEALTNVEKHAQAKTVRLRLSFQGDTVVLRIQDDGRGFAPQRSKARKGKMARDRSHEYARAGFVVGREPVRCCQRQKREQPSMCAFPASMPDDGGRSTRSGWRPSYAIAVAKRNHRFTNHPLPPKSPRSGREHCRSSALTFSSSARNE